MIYVLDACAMIAYLCDEKGAEVVEACLADEENDCLAHAVNLCEVYYNIARDDTLAEAAALNVADEAIATLLGAGVTLREDFDLSFVKRVGQLKSRGGISLADCFAIALAQRTGAQVLTGDHTQFDPIAARGIRPIRFIR